MVKYKNYPMVVDFIYILPQTVKKYWRMNYRYADKQKTLSFGTYPQVTLAEARIKREEAKKSIADNNDPSLEKKIQKQKILEKYENNFENIAREWHAKQEKKLSLDYWKNKLHRLEIDIFPKIGAFPISDIKAPQILSAIQDIEKRGANEIARRVLQMCGQIFRYAIVTSRLDTDPTQALKGALESTQKGHYASIETHELPDLIRKIERNENRLFPTTIHAIKLMMLTFVRTGELIGAKWNEFNFDKKQWLIPAERMKMKREHIVPLSKQTITILEKQKSYCHNLNDGFVFPSQIHSAKSMSNNTILKALERMGYKGKMTGHGFRSLAMTTLIETLGYRREIPDRQLAHTERNKIIAAYDRSKFINERTVMMQEWADYLDGLI